MIDTREIENSLSLLIVELRNVGFQLERLGNIMVSQDTEDEPTRTK